VPISGLCGDNMLTRVDPSKQTWYTGGCLMEVLDDLPIPKRDEKGPLRIPIMDKYKDASFFNIYGKVESGTII